MLAYDHRVRILCSREHFTERLKDATDNIYLKPGMKCSANVPFCVKSEDSQQNVYVVINNTFTRYLIESSCLAA